MQEAPESQMLATAPGDSLQELTALRNEVASLRDEIARESSARLLAWGPGGEAEGARNLACYLSLRSRDLNALQLRLSAFGLSSLGRSEADVLTALDALLFSLSLMCGEPAQYPPRAKQRAGEKARFRACDLVFGDNAHGRVRVMVTLPSEAADDGALVSSLI